MIIRLSVAAACVAFAAGCTTSSGLTYNNDVITLANGTQAHRVQCLGLAQSSQSCMDQVKKVCGDRQALRVSAVDRAAAGYKPDNDPREILFTCAAPVVPQPAPPVATQPVARPAPPAPVRKVTLQGDANFELNSASLTQTARANLDDLIAANRGVDIQQLTIAGYTDSTGSTALNERLSVARARSVQAYLGSHGLRAAKYSVNGYGSASPVAPNSTAAGRAKNRRVEILVEGQ
ncbi:OmpA family protein [Paraburkholderia rhizosphaerae]|uniref:Outer membrane protein OmpA-like peptidoglycan-associated protein n=1 Tax=Paraburkholderia rhizosphaerae TaxID=480658 RepID=A0A4R8LYH6_9BURK|nr:OmpA family protein [Paraburkholderia rhizosphaerae]TDY51726.1 outer membrane protein OmpA-like peptidoglycan-associated protein [Paraburkholderia rhizosphaerae]